MSSVTIKDGTGSGYISKVSQNNRLLVSATVEDLRDHAAESGNKFNINTGDITLTSAAKTTVLYLKNNEDDPLLVNGIIYLLGNSTGGSGDGKMDVIRNPTAGDIITNANNVATGTGIESNLNFGSTKTLTADMYKGATGETVVSGSDGISISTILSTPSGRNALNVGAITIPRGSSIAIDYTPQTGNTSQTIQVALSVFLKTAAVGGF